MKTIFIFLFAIYASCTTLFALDNPDMERAVAWADMEKVESTAQFTIAEHVILTLRKRDNSPDYTSMILGYDLPLPKFCTPEAECEPMSIFLELKIDEIKLLKDKCGRDIKASLIPNTSTVFKKVNISLRDRSGCTNGLWNPIWLASVKARSNGVESKSSTMVLHGFPHM